MHVQIFAPLMTSRDPLVLIWPQVEDPKKALLLFGGRTSQVVKDVLSDFGKLKGVRSTMFCSESHNKAMAFNTVYDGLQHARQQEVSIASWCRQHGFACGIEQLVCSALKACGPVSIPVADSNAHGCTSWRRQS